MAYTDADLVAVRAAIAKGEVEVRFADRWVRYRSIKELLEAEAHILGELATAAPTRSKQFHGVASGKGF